MNERAVGESGAVQDVGKWIEAHVERLVDDAMDAMSREVPDYFGALDSTLEVLAREATRTNLLQIAAELSDGGHFSRTPKAAIDEARAAAQMDIPWVPFQRCYSVALAMWWEEIYHEIVTWSAKADSKDHLVLVVSRFLFSYFDIHLSALEREYSNERDRTRRLHERQRLALIRHLLDGAPVSEKELDYPLSAQHLALVVWGRDPERTAGRLAASIPGKAMSVSGTGDAVWLWIGARRIGGSAVDSLRGAEPENGTFVAVGEPGPGLDGFRRSHREALRALRIGMMTGDGVTIYRDVQLETLAFHDERSARELVESVLKRLAGPDRRNQALRETLQAYFRAGQSRASAATGLGVHERTVSYRLATIETALGHTIAERRDELSLALRIHALLERSRKASGGSADSIPPPATTR